MGPPERTVSGSVNAAFLDEMNHSAQPESSAEPDYQEQKQTTPETARAREIQQVGAAVGEAANPTRNLSQPYAGPWLSTAQRESLQRAISFNDQGPVMSLASSGGASSVKSSGAGTPRSPAEAVQKTMPCSADDWFTEQEREHIPSLLGLGEYIGPGCSWKTPIVLNPGTGIVLSGKFLPAGSSRYEKHFSFGLDLWDMTLPFSSSNIRQRALYINPIFSTKEIQIGSLIDDEFVGVRHVAEGDKFPFKPGGKFTFAILCRDKGFKVWWKGTLGEGGTIYNYQYDVEKIKYLRVYDCHAIYIALGFRF